MPDDAGSRLVYFNLDMQRRAFMGAKAPPCLQLPVRTAQMVSPLDWLLKLEGSLVKQLARQSLPLHLMIVSRTALRIYQVVQTTDIAGN